MEALAPLVVVPAKASLCARVLFVTPAEAGVHSIPRAGAIGALLEDGRMDPRLRGGDEERMSAHGAAFAEMTTDGRRVV